MARNPNPRASHLSPVDLFPVLKATTETTELESQDKGEKVSSEDQTVRQTDEPDEGQEEKQGKVRAQGTSSGKTGVSPEVKLRSSAQGEGRKEASPADSVVSLPNHASVRKSLQSNRWKSTGDLTSSPLIPDHNTLNLPNKAILDPSVAIEFGRMAWRNLRLEAKAADDDVAEAVRVLTSFDDGGHPLQTPLGKIQENEPLPSPSDKNVEKTESFEDSSSTMSPFPYFLRKKSRRQIRRGRRFIDLTPRSSSFDDANDADDANTQLPVQESFETPERPSLAYSVDFSSTRSVDTTSSGHSIARRFIDLTRETSGTNKRGSLRSIASSNRSLDSDADGSMSSVLSAFAADQETPTRLELEAAQMSHRLSLDDDASFSSVDSDDLDTYTSEAWERADEAFLEEAHDLARGLERMLHMRGHESPFWPINEVSVCVRICGSAM